MPINIKISDRVVGEGAPTFIIAEIGLAHDGSLGFAHAFIDAVADAGVDAVKFQTHIAEAESTPDEQFRVKVFPQDATRFDYWKRTSFNHEQWSGLKLHADRRGIIFLSSPFSLAAVRLLDGIGTPAWKIGSGEVFSRPMLEQLVETNKPVLLSTGMSSLAEVDSSVAFWQERGVPLVLFQCTSRYPCPPESWGLNLIKEFQERYQIPVGLSDHSGVEAAGLAAVALGADALEVHVTWHRGCFGPDVPASLTLEELTRLVRGIRLVDQAVTHPADKDKEAADLEYMRSLFTKSVVAARPLPAGTLLSAIDFDYKKPGTGIPAEHSAELEGRRLARDLDADEQIAWSDLIDE